MATKLSELIEFVKENNKSEVKDAFFIQLDSDGQLAYPGESGDIEHHPVSEVAMKELCKLNGINWSYFRKIPNELKQANLNWFLERSKDKYVLNYVDQTVSEVHGVDSAYTVGAMLDIVAEAFGDNDPYIIQPYVDAGMVAFYAYYGDETEYPFGNACNGIIVWAPLDKDSHINASPVLVFPETETAIEFNIDGKRHEDEKANGDVPFGPKETIQYALDNMKFMDRIIAMGIDNEVESVEHFFQHDAHKAGVRGKLNSMAYDNSMSAQTCIDLVKGILQTEEQVSDQGQFMSLANLAGHALHPSTPTFCSHCHQVIDDGDDD